MDINIKKLVKILGDMADEVSRNNLGGRTIYFVHL